MEWHPDFVEKVTQKRSFILPEDGSGNIRKGLDKLMSDIANVQSLMEKDISNVEEYRDFIIDLQTQAAQKIKEPSEKQNDDTKEHLQAP